MPSLDAQIDALYQLPLDQFIQARKTLAKSLTGEEAARVRALAKPTVVPWAVNQVYWRVRPVYDRLVQCGLRVRHSQIAALEGKKADVAGNLAAHREAVADAIAQAQKLAAGAGAAPDTDALMRTFESLSLAATQPSPPGRLTGALQPAGFEALAGVKPAVTGSTPDRGTASTAIVPALATPTRKPSPTDLKRQRDAEVARLAEVARRAKIADAEAELARVENEEHRAREAWERAHEALLAARRALFNLKSAI